MKKAANILFLVGMILSIILAVTYALCALLFIVLGTLPAVRDMVIEGINNGTIVTYFDSPEEAATFFQIMFVVAGVTMIPFIAFSGVSAFFSGKARTNGEKKLYILNIVFGILSGTTVNVVGGILSLISESKQGKREY